MYHQFLYAVIEGESDQQGQSSTMNIVHVLQQRFVTKPSKSTWQLFSIRLFANFIINWLPIACTLLPWQNLMSAIGTSLQDAHLIFVATGAVVRQMIVVICQFDTKPVSNYCFNRARQSWDVKCFTERFRSIRCHYPLVTTLGASGTF